jgi:hypothetical protein
MVSDYVLKVHGITGLYERGAAIAVPFERRSIERLTPAWSVTQGDLKEVSARMNVHLIAVSKLNPG